MGSVAVTKRRPRQFFLAHQVADRMAPMMRRAFMGAIIASRSRITTDLLSRYWSQGPEAVFQALPWMDMQLDWLNDFAPALLVTLQVSLERQAQVLRVPKVEKQDAPIGDLGFSLDLTNPRALKWAQEHAADLVVGLSEESKAAVRQLITRMFAEGIDPQTATRMLREQIGLTPRDLQAVANLREQRERENAQRLLDRRRLISAEQIDAEADRLARRYLRQRATAIVRTESMTASNRGQTELWAQAADAGYLQRDEARRAALITPDEKLCDLCAPLASHDRLVGLDEPFVIGDGSSVMNPPFHVTCRCALGLVFPDETGAFHHPQA